LVLAPHPDDETLCCSGVIQQALAQHVPVRIVFLTYGDSNEWSFIVSSHHLVVPGRSALHFGMIRHDEAMAADQTLGVDPQQIVFLGYPDHGTLDMFTSHWGSRPPLTALLTRQKAVPYPTAVRPGAPYTGDSVLQDLEAQMREFKPTRIFVSHPADANVDHRAYYLYARVALWETGISAEVYPFLTHWPHWPEPHGYRPDQTLDPPAVLKDQLSWHVDPLTAVQIGVKKQALACHKTQMSYSAGYLMSFIKQNELFGDLARLDLRHVAPVSSGTPDEAMPGAEPSSLVGNEWKFVRVDDQGRLELSIEESRPLARETEAAFYAFGYRPDKRFADMPKIHVVAGLRSSADDQGRRISAPGLEMVRRGRRITVRIPLSLLGDPDRVLVSSRTWLGGMALDWSVWYEVDLPSGALPPSRCAGAPPARSVGSPAASASRY
ncbi:MAG TPA: PIG-L family deacetylase, partial [Candidatus Xenobia bacterium]